MGHYPNTALFNNPPKKIPGAGEWPKLFREINYELTRLCGGVWCVYPCFCPKGGKFSRGAALPNAPSTAHGARSAAATELRRSRCCDGDAQTSSVALSARRVRDAAWVKKIKSCVWVATHRIRYSRCSNRSVGLIVVPRSRHATAVQEALVAAASATAAFPISSTALAT